MKIVDLARDLIKLSGFRPEKDIPIVFTAARPGEKLFEDLFASGERVRKTGHERIMVVESGNCFPPVLDEIIFKGCRGEWQLDEKESLELLRMLVPGYGCPIRQH